MITGLIWCRLLTVSITAFTTKQCEPCSKGQGALLRGDLDFISKKYNKPIPAEEAILIALISGADVLQVEAERGECEYVYGVGTAGGGEQTTRD